MKLKHTHGTQLGRLSDNVSVNLTGLFSLKAFAPSAASLFPVSDRIPLESSRCCSSTLSAACQTNPLVMAIAGREVFSESSWANFKAAGSTASRVGRME